MTLSEIIDLLLSIFSKPKGQPDLLKAIDKISPTATPLNQMKVPLQSAPIVPSVATWLDICLPVTRHYETCVLFAYPDPGSALAQAMQAAGIWYNFLAGKHGIPAAMDDLSGAPWTIGWGATGTGIEKGVVWTQVQADNVLIDRLNSACAAVKRYVKVALTASQLAALTDLAYNIGETAFANSTLVRFLNENSPDAAAQILVWNKSGGQVSNGLVKRRKTDYDLFTTGSYQL